MGQKGILTNRHGKFKYLAQGRKYPNQLEVTLMPDACARTCKPQPMVSGRIASPERKACHRFAHEAVDSKIASSQSGFSQSMPAWWLSYSSPTSESTIVNWGSSSILIISYLHKAYLWIYVLGVASCKVKKKKMLKIPGRIPSRATAWKDLRAMARLLGRCRYHKLDSGMMAEPQITCSKAGTTPKAKTQRQSEMAQQTRLATRMPLVPIITRIAPCSPRRPAGTTSPM